MLFSLATSRTVEPSFASRSLPSILILTILSYFHCVQFAGIKTGAALGTQVLIKNNGLFLAHKSNRLYRARLNTKPTAGTVVFYVIMYKRFAYSSRALLIFNMSYVFIPEI